MGCGRSKQVAPAPVAAQIPPEAPLINNEQLADSSQSSPINSPKSTTDNNNSKLNQKAISPKIEKKTVQASIIQDDSPSAPPQPTAEELAVAAAEKARLEAEKARLAAEKARLREERIKQEHEKNHSKLWNPRMDNVLKQGVGLLGSVVMTRAGVVIALTEVENVPLLTEDQAKDISRKFLYCTIGDNISIGETKYSVTESESRQKLNGKDETGKLSFAVSGSSQGYCVAWGECEDVNTPQTATECNSLYLHNNSSIMILTFISFLSNLIILYINYSILISKYV